MCESQEPPQNYKWDKDAEKVTHYANTAHIPAVNPKKQLFLRCEVLASAVNQLAPL